MGLDSPSWAGRTIVAFYGGLLIGLRKFTGSRCNSRALDEATAVMERPSDRSPYQCEGSFLHCRKVRYTLISAPQFD
jgi:hypothetical protein